MLHKKTIYLDKIQAELLTQRDVHISTSTLRLASSKNVCSTWNIYEEEIYTPPD